MFDQVFQVFLGPGVRLYPLYLASFALIAYAVFRRREAGSGPAGFLAWLFPRDIYLHASHLTDLKLFVLGRILTLMGIVGTVGLRTVVIAATMAGLAPLTGTSSAQGQWSAAEAAAAVATIVLVSDLCVYWVHRIHHEHPVLWPFHAVHHSAEVMTPLTVYRKHPLYDLFSSVVKNLALGVTLGVALALVTDTVDIVMLTGINAAYFLFNILGSNFRHTHVWISYGPVLERVFISPAQHQVHHSRAVEHHDRNYGEIFALWDWMFGTLYVPDRRETLEFGLATRDGVAIEQPHPTLAAALWQPFRDSAGAWRERATGKAPVANPAPPT